MDISEGSDIPGENIMLAGWRFGKTTAAMYCMISPQSKVGDIICVPMGGQVPLFLRPRSRDREVYGLIEETYVHGVTDGMGMLRALSNMNRMMQADPNHDFEQMARRLEDEKTRKWACSSTWRLSLSCENPIHCIHCHCHCHCHSNFHHLMLIFCLADTTEMGCPHPLTLKQN